MIKADDTFIYSIKDVVNTLKKFDGDEAYEFASELTGLSVDALAELTDDIYNK